MTVDPSIIGGGAPLFVGSVVSVNYTDKNADNIYSIIFKPVADKTVGYTQTYSARPIDARNTEIPLKGELVLIVAAPNSNATAHKEFDDFYFIQTLNIQNQVSSNQKPDSAQTPVATSTGDNAEGYNEVKETSQPKKNNEGNATLTQKDGEATLGENYVEPDNADRISPLQPYEGDKILQGRFGNSIRFGSSFSKDLSVFSLEPTWKKDSDSEDGMPNVIISCGRKPGAPGTNGNTFNNFAVEDPNEDSSMIWLTKGQIITGFKKNANSTTSMNKEGINTWKNEFGGNQVFINSDRIIMNTKKDEIVMFSEGGIGLASNKSITIDTPDNFSISTGKKVFLGKNGATEPVMLGNTFLTDFASMVTALNTLAIACSAGTVIPPLAFLSNPSIIAAGGALTPQTTKMIAAIERYKSKTTFTK